jgi:formate/nitrite transporter FocA (FNT family)
MERPATSLWWSGLAAGLSMSFSLLAMALLEMHLPDAPWRSLVRSLGYPIGFLMVVLGRQQLFTENTITVVLPVMAEPTRRNFWRAGRMWSIVLVANLAGTLFAALFCTFTPVLDADVRIAMMSIARESLDHDALGLLFRGITAGFLMAAMVWLIPASSGAQFQVVATMTYLISLSGAAHIVAGSVESFVLLMGGGIGVGQMLGSFVLPVLVGNIVGGAALFALLSYAQVMKEI